MLKNEVIKSLESIINHHKEQEASTKATNVATLKRLVKKSNIEEYKNAFTNKQGHVNIGYVGEALALKYLGLEKEDNSHEIKTFINNPTNVLNNEDVTEVYIIVVSKYLNGFYKINADIIRGVRFGIKDLYKNINNLVKVCTLAELVK